MDKFNKLIDEINTNIDVLRIRMEKTTDEYYDLTEENRHALVTIEKLEAKITELTNIEYVLTHIEQLKRANREIERQVTKMSFWTIVLLASILVITTEALPFYFKDMSTSLIEILKSSFLGTIGAVTISTVVGLTVFHYKEHRKHKNIIKRNDLASVRQKLNRNEKKKAKLEKTVRRNDEKVARLNTKIDILEEGMNNFVHLKHEVRARKEVAKNYANAVINAQTETIIYSSEEYDSLINQRYDNDEIIKDIIKRERKIKNDN